MTPRTKTRFYNIAVFQKSYEDNMWFGKNIHYIWCNVSNLSESFDGYRDRIALEVGEELTASTCKHTLVPWLKKRGEIFLFYDDETDLDEYIKNSHIHYIWKFTPEADMLHGTGAPGKGFPGNK